MEPQRVRTTVALPADLVEAADRAVRQGNARSRNELLVMALRREVAALERAAVDAALAAMAEDGDAQQEALAIVEEFAAADAINAADLEP